MEIAGQCSGEGPESRRLYVTRLNPKTKKLHLLKLFSQYGAIHVVVLRKATGNTAFITFRTPEETSAALKAVQDVPLIVHNRKIRVLRADLWHDLNLIVPQKILGSSPGTFERCNLPEERKLPEDIIAIIGTYLPFADRSRMEIVCRSWREGMRKSMREITELKLNDSRWEDKKVTKEAFYWLVQRCGPYLRKVNVDSSLCTNFQPQLISILVKTAKVLEELCLTSVTIRSNAIRELAGGIRSLKILKLGACEGQIDMDLRIAFTNCELTHFASLGKNITGFCLLGLIYSLEELRLEESHVRSHHLTIAITSFSKLRALYIVRPKQFENSIIHALVNNEILGDTMKILHLNYCNPKLEAIDDMNIEDDDDDGNILDYFEIPLNNLNAKISIPRRFVNITDLSLQFCGWVDNMFIWEIGQFMPKLEHLDIAGCTNIREQFALDPLGRLKRLETLNMSLLHISVGGYFLVRLPKLKMLICRENIGITNEDTCGVIQDCLCLQTLDVEGCPNVGRPTVDFIKRVLGNAPERKVRVYLGGTAARPYRKDRRLMNVEIIYNQGFLGSFVPLRRR